MELDELISLIADPGKLKEKLSAEKGERKIDDFLKQKDPAKHDVMDAAKRPDKQVQTDSGTSAVPVSRLPVPLQKKIVNMSVCFLAGNPIELDANPKDELQHSLLDVLRKTWNDAKLDYDNKQLAKLMMSETECAELWYTEKVEPEYWNYTANEGVAKFRLRMRVLANSLGDTLYPVMNKMGDMIAFGRSYSLTEQGKNVEHLDIYTDATTYLFVKSEQGWSTPTTEANPSKKIPVIYYSQAAPEWSDVQWLIDRFEKSLSNHGDTNDYYGSPTVLVKGKVAGFAKKGEQGKVLELEAGAEASYLTWDQSPKSVELEQKNLRSLIFDMTDTPDISFENMKSLGTFSGIALKLLFMGAHMKASDKEEIFGKGIQRRINFLKTALAKINVKLEPAVQMSIKPQFEYFLPKDDKEAIDNIATALQGGFLSTESAVELSPLTTDATAELEKVQAAGLDKEMVDA